MFFQSRHIYKIAEHNFSRIALSFTVLVNKHIMRSYAAKKMLTKNSARTRLENAQKLSAKIYPVFVAFGISRNLTNSDHSYLGSNERALILLTLIGKVNK